MAIAWIDVVIISLIALSAILSLFRGFVKEALALVTWLVALWVAMAFYEELGTVLSQWSIIFLFVQTDPFSGLSKIVSLSEDIISFGLTGIS